VEPLSGALARQLGTRDDDPPPPSTRHEENNPMLRRTLPIAVRFIPALAPALYLQLHWTLPATKSGQDLADILTGWFIITCAALAAASRYLPKAER
jgi:hypothetical protein